MRTLFFAPFVAVAMACSTGTLAQDAAKLAQEKACLSCHSVDKKLVGPAYKEISAKYKADKVDKKLVGPAYKEISAKYKADKGAEARLVKKVREGSTGVWGQVPMPPNTTVSEKEAAILVKWVLSQK